LPDPFRLSASPMTDPRIISIGAPETAADFPGIDLYCTQRRGR